MRVRARAHARVCVEEEEEQEEGGCVSGVAANAHRQLRRQPAARQRPLWKTNRHKHLWTTRRTLFRLPELEEADEVASDMKVPLLRYLSIR